MATGTWTGIKTAVRTLIATMTQANSYNYNWVQHNREDIHQTEDVFVKMSTPDGEDNNDSASTVVNTMDQVRRLTFYTYINNPNGGTELDDIMEDLEDLQELALQDFKLKFNGTIYDELCAQGVKKFDYFNMRWEPQLTSGQYDSIKMLITYNVEYKESRNIS